MITVCFVHFRTLTLDHFAAALYSVRQQDLSSVESVVIVDNNTDDSYEDLTLAIEMQQFPVPVHLHTYKHGDHSKTHAWSTNTVVSKVQTPWVLMTRADYLLAPDIVAKFVREIPSNTWRGFVTSNGCHVDLPLDACELADWKHQIQNLQRNGTIYDYTCVDAGVWLARKEDFDFVGGIDERLTAWGHAQTHFQWKLHQNGVMFVRVPEVLFYHPQHGGGEKDMVQANQQIKAIGADLHEMWLRYPGMY